jgi:hypothetical protein
MRVWIELLLLTASISLRNIRTCNGLITPRTRTVRAGSVKLGVMPSFEEEEEEEDGTELEKKLQRPTLTEFEVQGPKVQPEKPKIVVLGASGRIGR